LEDEPSELEELEEPVGELQFDKQIGTYQEKLKTNKMQQLSDGMD